MHIKASKEVISAANAYEGFHVPALFQQFAPLVVDAARVRPDQRVLDIACGTGVLTREAAARVGENGHMTGLDVAPGMLAVAQQLDPSIDWRLSIAESLPYEDNSFDAVICQFGLMFFQDPRAAIREMSRVLIPGSLMAVAVWDSLENSEAYPDEIELLERIAGQPTADGLRAPFVLGDREGLSKLFRDSGLISVEITT